jgi:hypothetical protein
VCLWTQIMTLSLSRSMRAFQSTELQAGAPE